MRRRRLGNDVIDNSSSYFLALLFNSCSSHFVVMFWQNLESGRESSICSTHLEGEIVDVDVWAYFIRNEARYSLGFCCPSQPKESIAYLLGRFFGFVSKRHAICQPNIDICYSQIYGAHPLLRRSDWQAEQCLVWFHQLKGCKIDLVPRR